MTYPWNAGDVLAAADLNSAFASKVDYATPANAQSGTGASAYTFVLADATRLTTATGTSAKTFTIPPQSSVVWLANSIIRVANYGAGDLTIAGGSGVTVTNATKTLAQYESAALVRTGSNAWTLLPFSGGAGNADFSDAATGTYTDGGISYKYITYTASGTLTVTKAGFADVLVVGGGGGGGASAGGGGGAGGHLVAAGAYLPVGTLTVTVGGGGAGGLHGSNPFQNSYGKNGTSSRIDSYYGVGGGGAGGGDGNTSHGIPGGSGGGANYFSSTAGTGTSGQGNSGGNGHSNGGSNYGGGGGGGANAAGANGTSGQSGAGGAGLANSYTGASVTRAGGGGAGGAASSAAGAGGSGGGGGGSNSGTGTSGSANTGGGGGGSAPATNGAAGGSGVVIIRVKV